MKKTIFLFGMLGVSILFAGCGSQPTPTPENIGGAQDEHGCYTTAGYSWSEEQQECIRPWEVGTGTTGDKTLLGGDRDEHGCIPSAGYSRSEELQECVRPREINQTGIELQTYNNEKYSFSLGYPTDRIEVDESTPDQDWVTFMSPDLEGMASQADQPDFQAYNISVIVAHTIASDKSLDDIEQGYLDFLNSEPSGNFTSSRVTINGNEFVKFEGEYSEGGNMVYQQLFLTFKNGIQYDFTYSVLSAFANGCLPFFDQSSQTIEIK